MIKHSSVKIHLIFLSILSLNYLIPIFIFGNITLFYHDALDGDIVYNHILGKIYDGNFDSIKSFLGGQIENEYLRRLFFPISLLYALFTTEVAYWTTDIIVKITSYFSFFILSKKLSNNIFLCALLSCLFASINIPTISGLGLAILPYLIYLIFFKKQIKLKNYLVIIFFGLNSDFVTTIPLLPFTILVLMVIDYDLFKIKFNNFIKIFSTFIICIILANSNLIYAELFGVTSHREAWVREPVSLMINLSDHFLQLIKLPRGLNWTFFYMLPFTIFLIPTYIFCFISKNNISRKLFYLILFMHLFFFFLNLEPIINFRNSSSGILRTFNFTYSLYLLPLIYVLMILDICKKNERYNKILIFSCLLSIFLFQINSSIVPIYKKFLKKEDNYKNIYTFEGYYSYKDYNKIKNIVKNQRVLSVGLDPMVAIMNDINTIDGYHNLYPLDYKLKFRKVIEKELSLNQDLKKYYDNWGNRVYAFINNPDEIFIDYFAAKKLGAKFVISKFTQNSVQLDPDFISFGNKLHLYKIK